ncbi:MAG: cbb3-type cytochrome oxidase assembly protein CcoS, partial [Rubritepida sp.]|nr:cbb3-type cytochrome oxidase assembly protein CcoS [Rubritepida sp.]
EDGVGMTLHLARPDRAPVAFRFADALRADAAEAVAAFRRAGLGVELLSGDAPALVGRVAGELAIATWRGGATPADKAARLAMLAAQGRRVLMVGDGVNDAAALAAAHVAAAPAEGTDIAQAASDLVLQGGGLLPLAEAIHQARRAQRLAAQNIGFALAYNIVAVPVAVAGFATPLALGALGLAGFLWALRSGQFEDLDGAAARILFDDDPPKGPR